MPVEQITKTFQNKKQHVYYRQPTSESLQKLQAILTRKLKREVSLDETTQAYYALMGFAFAIVDMVPDNSIYPLIEPLAKITNNDVEC